MPTATLSTRPLHVGVASASDRLEIYRLRHQVYAAELRQHAVNARGTLRDDLDEENIYLAVRDQNEVVGFVSLTPPDSPFQSVDKYFTAEQLAPYRDERTWEVRLLTVAPSRRFGTVAALLLWAALRWVESHGGQRIIAIGRVGLLEFYEKAGLLRRRLRARSGAVEYELLTASTDRLRRAASTHDATLERLSRQSQWRLPMRFRSPAACFHGGAFFDAVGEDLDDLSRHHEIVNADVLDAWFPPAPDALGAIEEHLAWIARTSPPTACSGLVRAISTTRGIPEGNLIVGAGSSALIFLALCEWLRPTSHVLLVDPTYGEYAHVVEKVIGCRVTRFRLARAERFRIDLLELERQVAAASPDLVILVNPNSPTGSWTRRAELEPLLYRWPDSVRLWIDETYIDYASSAESVESLAADSENLIVCKSMSKAYALSGLRVAYLAAGLHQLERLRARTPPWAVSLPAQLAAIRALKNTAYYEERWRETRELRRKLARRLRDTLPQLEVLEGPANFLLAFLPEDGPSAATVVERCQQEGVFLRDAMSTGEHVGRFTLRVAVKGAKDNARIVRALTRALDADAMGRVASMP